MAISRWKTFGASASLAGVSVLTAASAAAHWRALGFHTVAVAGFVGASALLFLRRSALAQFFARGVAWSVIIPASTVAIMAWTHGFSPGARLLAPPILAGLSLVLSRSALDSDAARSTFSPIAFRKSLMMATTAAFGVGLTFAEMGATFAAFRMTHLGLALGVLGASLVATGIGVARMRAWGMLLGMATALVAAPLALTSGPVLGWPTLLAAIPGLIMASVLVLARAGVGTASNDGEAAFVKTRVIDVQPRARVVLDGGEDEVAEAAAAPFRRPLRSS